MKSLTFLILALILILSVPFYYTDIKASSRFQPLLLPFMDFLLLCGLALWLTGRTGWNSLSRHDGGSFFDSFDSDGSDGGG